MSRPVRIAVDSTVNFSPEEQAQLGIEVLPIIHITGLPQETENRLKQGDYRALYQLISARQSRRLVLGTHAGSPWEIKQILESVIRKYDCDLVCFVVSGQLSGVYDNTRQAAQELSRKHPNRIVVFGEQAFITLSILARTAAAYAMKGKSIDEVLEFVEDKLSQGFVCGCLLDVRRLRRSGRVPIPALLTTIAQPFLKIFRLLPFFILEGEKPRTMALVRKSQFERFVLDTIRQRVGFQEPIVAQVSWTGSEVMPDAERLRKIIENQSEFALAEPVLFQPANPVIGVHAGAALVAFGVLGLGYETISTSVFLHFLNEAQKELKIFQRTVNAINVFPVRDGDTGSNLLSPLTGAGVDIDVSLPFGQMLKQVAIRIARKGGGYSGGAIAAYFLGLSEYVERHNPGSDLTVETLVKALKAGTDRCYAYFGSEAKEGTILSVMRACDQAAQKAFEQRPTLRNVLTSAYFAATEELLNPKVQEVEILRQERLVDAGGFGFTLILWALLRTLGIARDPRLKARYQLVLKEAQRHGELAQRLIYRHQPPELRGFCVEGCVQGEVAEELNKAFLMLDNRLPNPKITFNVVDGTTHFHIHVSEGLEQEVLRIAARFGYAVPPKPPTRLAKRKREIYRFRFARTFNWARKVPGYVVRFFANWVAYAVLFPIMWYRAHHRYQTLQREVERLRLIQRAFESYVQTGEGSLLVLDSHGTVIFASDWAYGRTVSEASSLEKIFPAEVVRLLRDKTEEAISQRCAEFELNIGQFWFDVKVLRSAGLHGFLVRYGQIHKI